MPEQEDPSIRMETAFAAHPIFRAMKEDRDGYPVTGCSSRTLGVRIDGPSHDILVALDGTVSPGTGGMSVALDAARNLPKHRLPKSLGGEAAIQCSGCRQQHCLVAWRFARTGTLMP